MLELTLIFNVYKSITIFRQWNNNWNYMYKWFYWTCDNNWIICIFDSNKLVIITENTFISDSNKDVA